MEESPENTMTAFRRAQELGADIVEIDLYTSIDGHLFILHDSTLDRTTDGGGEATDLTLEELQALDAGSWFGPEYAGEQIPSFREVLEWATEEDVVLLLDLKESGPEFADNVAGDILQYEVEGNMVVGVRSPEQAGEFRERLPNARQLAFMGSPDDIEAYAEEGVDVLRLWLRWLDEDPTLADRVRQTGKKLMINGTLGELEEAKAIMDFEPDWILIDDVAQLQESLQQIASEEEDGITQTGKVHTGARHLVIVVDGLRPDYVTPDIMPNLYAMGQRGVVGTNSFSVFPSFTRPNRTSIPTGVYPHKHGLIHNSMFHPDLDSPVHTGRINDMTEYTEVTDSPIATTVSLGELMEEEGKNLLAIGHGSWLMNHKEKGKGWMMPGNFSQPDSVVEEVLDAVGETPTGSRSPARTAWVTDLYLYDSLGEEPADVVLMWYGETDAAGHSYGVGAPETLEAVSHVDEQIGRILETHEEHGLSGEVNIFVTSDHGFTQNTGNFSSADFVEEAGLADQVDFTRNMFYVENGNEETMQQMVETLQRNKYVGAVYTQPVNSGDTEGRVPGTLSTDLIQWTHERSSDIIASPAWSHEENEFGWSGTTTRSGTATHGTDSPYDMRIPLVAAGPDIKQGVESSVPTGNVDFTPTVLHLMGITPPDHMDGRILHEILISGPHPGDIDFEELIDYNSVSFQDGFTYETELTRYKVESTFYIKEATTKKGLEN